MSSKWSFPCSSPRSPWSWKKVFHVNQSILRKAISFCLPLIPHLTKIFFAGQSTEDGEELGPFFELSDKPCLWRWQNQIHMQTHRRQIRHLPKDLSSLYSYAHFMSKDHFTQHLKCVTEICTVLFFPSKWLINVNLCFCSPYPPPHDAEIGDLSERWEG